MKTQDPTDVLPVTKGITNALITGQYGKVTGARYNGAENTYTVRFESNVEATFQPDGELIGSEAVTVETFTVYGVPKDREDDMTEGRGLPKRGAEGVTLDEAIDYADRNESPDNDEQCVVRNDQTGAEVYR